MPHAEQYITNANDRILFNFNPIELTNAPKSDVSIAVYSLNYGKDKVISLGVYSNYVIQNENFDKFFDNLIVKYVLHSDIKL